VQLFTAFEFWAAPKDLATAVFNACRTRWRRARSPVIRLHATWAEFAQDLSVTAVFFDASGPGVGTRRCAERGSIQRQVRILSRQKDLQGGPKPADCFWVLITQRRLVVERHVIYQSFQNFVAADGSTVTSNSRKLKKCLPAILETAYRLNQYKSPAVARGSRPY